MNLVYDSPSPKLPDGVKLVNTEAHGVFWREGNWYFIQDLAVPLVWSPNHGWQKYYEAERADFRFHSTEDAMKAWASKPLDPSAVTATGSKFFSNCGMPFQDKAKF